MTGKGAIMVGNELPTALLINVMYRHLGKVGDPCKISG